MDLRNSYEEFPGIFLGVPFEFVRISEELLGHPQENIRIRRAVGNSQAFLKNSYELLRNSKEL